jgi:hypothetical protein
MNFAAVFRAPCVLICQNNHWAISVPAARQTASVTIAVKGRAYGVPSVRVDGNDVLAVYRAVVMRFIQPVRAAGHLRERHLAWARTPPATIRPAIARKKKCSAGPSQIDRPPGAAWLISGFEWRIERALRAGSTSNQPCHRRGQPGPRAFDAVRRRLQELPWHLEGSAVSCLNCLRPSH